MINNELIIDVVIPWVNGNDPAILQKHALFTTKANETSRPEIGGATRFTDSREIEYCVASVLIFAPFVRNIFIITDSQDPKLGDMISSYFSNRKDSIKVIDHKEIFKDYEEFLPTFNCNSIETMMWRISGLSEHFIYMNDDFFLTSPVKPTDFFTSDGRPIGYWQPLSTFWMKLISALKPNYLGYKFFMLNAAKIAGSNYIPLLGHTPYCLTRSGLQKLYETNPNLITLNISDRFRSKRQFNPQVLYYLTNKNERRDFADKRIFIKSGRQGYMKRKLNQAQRMPNLIFGCINSFNQLSDEDQLMFRNWFTKRIELSQNIKER